MDWTSVIAAAMAGGIGGAGGALAGFLVAKVIKHPISGGRSGIAGLVSVVCMVLGYTLLTPVIEGAIGPSIRGFFGPPAELAQVDEDVRNEPLFAAMFDLRPELEADFERTITEAYQRGGGAAASSAAYEWSAAKVSGLVAEFAPYARDEDLEAWARGNVELLDALGEIDPMLCHDFMFGAQTGHPLSQGAMSAAMTERTLAFANEVLPPLLRNADPAVAHPTDEADQAAFLEIAGLLGAEVGQDRLRYLQGDRPDDVQDARIVCEAVIGYYSNVADHERAGSILRIMLSPQPAS